MNIVLLIASAIFYSWGGLRYFIILECVILANWFLALLMCKTTLLKKVLFILILGIDVGNLLYFKYFNFFVDNFRTVFGKGLLFDVAKVTLPIGISFYTFQIISYVADVFLGNVEVQKDPFKLSLYVTMFPQLIAGPIVRYKDINSEIDNRTISVEDVETGIKRFIIGFFKKVFIANAMGGMADAVFSLQGEVNTVYAWIGAICYTFQIYYDFSAYSDMAIGIGRIFGFNFMENFDLPYKSQSIQEFWRRWHISLSTWFRDYVYIPLGGNRKGLGRTYLNLCIVFLLTGFWHGAAWQFVIWGIFHGVFSIIERLGFKHILLKLPKVARHVYTMLVVILGWVFFRADNISSAMQYLRNMFSWNMSGFKETSVVLQFDNLFVFCFIVAMIFSVTHLEIIKKLKFWNNISFERIRYLLLWAVSVLYLTGLSYNPFIYFKF